MNKEEAIESFKHSNEQAKVRLEVEKMRMDNDEIKELEFYIERDEMAIKALEQEPKTGHWIEHPEIETSTPEYLMFYECSECGDKQCFCKSDIHKKHFCNNCGARMVEPQERSDKE